VRSDELGADRQPGWYAPKEALLIETGNYGTEPFLVPLYWGSEPPIAAPATGVFEPFCDLATATPVKVKRFVERFGALTVSFGGRPRLITERASPDAFDQDGALRFPVKLPMERVAWYQEFAVLLKQTVALADALRRGKTGEPEHAARIRRHLWWDTGNQAAPGRVRFMNNPKILIDGRPAPDPARRRRVRVPKNGLEDAAHTGALLSVATGLASAEQHWNLDPYDPHRAHDWRRSVREARGELVEAMVNWWLEVGYVRASMTWQTTERGAGARLRWPGSLWSALGGELLDRVRTASLADVCDNCGKPLNRERAAKRNQGNFCSNKCRMRVRRRPQSLPKLIQH